MGRKHDRYDAVISQIESLENKIQPTNQPEHDSIFQRIGTIAKKLFHETMEWTRINYRIHSAYMAGNHEIGYKYATKTIKQMRSDKGKAKTIGQVTKKQANNSHRDNLDNTFTENQIVEKITIIRKSDKKVISKGIRISSRYLTGISQNHIESKDLGEGQDGYHAGIVEFLQSTPHRIGWKEWTELTDQLDFVPFQPITDSNGNTIGMVPVGAPRLTYGWIRLGCRRITDNSKNWKRKPNDIGRYILRRHWEFLDGIIPDSIESKATQSQPVKPILSVGMVKNEVKGFPSDSNQQRTNKAIILMLLDGIKPKEVSRILDISIGHVWNTMARFRKEHKDLLVGQLVEV